MIPADAQYQKSYNTANESPTHYFYKTKKLVWLFTSVLLFKKSTGVCWVWSEESSLKLHTELQSPRAAQKPASSDLFTSLKTLMNFTPTRINVYLCFPRRIINIRYVCGPTTLRRTSASGHRCGGRRGSTQRIRLYVTSLMKIINMSNLETQNP